MEDIQEQLAILRRRIARIDKKWTGEGPARPRVADLPVPLRVTDLRPARYFVEELISGEVVHTAFGEHFETEKLFERHRRHGSMRSIIAPKPAIRVSPGERTRGGTYGRLRIAPPQDGLYRKR